MPTQATELTVNEQMMIEEISLQDLEQRIEFGCCDGGGGNGGTPDCRPLANCYPH